MKKKNKLNIKKIIVFLVILGIIAGLYINLKNKKNQNIVSEQIEQGEITNQNVNINQDSDKKEENIAPSKSLLEEKLESGKYLSDSGLPVLMYHFFYDKNEREPQDGNWIEINDFEAQMKYLSENDY